MPATLAASLRTRSGSGRRWRFRSARAGPGRTFLDLRGVNYTAEVYLNGIHVNCPGPLTGMFLRHRLDVTDRPPWRANILAVLVTLRTPR